MEKVRTFIAIKLTPEIISNIKRVQEKLKRSGAEVKWVKPENIHLTLKFLGYITPEDLENVKLATREALKSFASFEISVSGLGAFPKISYPRVIWVGVNKGKEELKKIVSNLEERLAIIGFAKEKRPFSPHLTLGRVRSQRGKEGLAEVLANTEVSHLGSLGADKIAIIKSELKPQGPVYSSLEEVDLRGKEE